MKHFLLTRWNQLDDTDSVYSFNKVNDPEKWNTERKSLFEKYCLPSVKAQTNKNFIWLLAFNSNTPKSLYSEYEKLPYVKIIFDCHPSTYIRNLKGNEIKEGEWITTSRLDNDDVIHQAYIDSVKNLFKGKEFIVDFNGCQYDTQTKRLHDPVRAKPNKAFLSLHEQVLDDIKTCCWKSHSNMYAHLPGRKYRTTMYCQIIHGNNIANKIVGKDITSKKELLYFRKLLK